jgi:ATP/maltotriose-dependent transcriptional regulator MalT
LIGLAALATELEMPAEGVPEELYTFFAEELYQAVPPQIQQGLRRLSLAPTITLDIAESLIGEHTAEVIHEGVELGFFLGGPRDRLELHPLLRSFLASKFRQRTDDPGRQILGRLAQTLMDLEEWDDVFELATLFLDDELLIKLFQAALPRMLEQARLPTLSRWIVIAAARGVDSPLIDLADAELAFRRGDLERGEALASQAARRLDSDHPLRSKALWVAGMSAHLIWRDEAAFKHFEAAEQSAHTEPDARQALWGRFIATEALEREGEAEVLLTHFIDRSESTVDELLRIGTGRFRMALLLGRVHETIESHRSLALLADRSRDPLIQTSFLNSYAALLAVGGLYEETLKVAENEMAFAREYLLDFVIPFAHFHVAESKWGPRNFRACKTSLEHSQRIAVNSNNEFLMSNIGALHARLNLANGAPDEALKVLDRWHRAALACPMHAEYLAWWSLAHAVAEQTRDATTLAAHAESMSRRIEVSALVPWTKAILAVNGPRSARDAAEGAFRIALESGNIDAFVAAYRARPELLELLVRDEANHSELRLILERARDHALAESVGLRLPPAPEQEGPTILSKREREVLQLVAQGLTNKEIGRTLFITEGTAKVHVRKICQKLGVRTRTEAAMRASELSD